jgi:hypothetical protein
VHIQLPSHQQAHGGCELGLGLQDLRGLLLDDEGAAGDTSDQTDDQMLAPGKGLWDRLGGKLFPQGSRKTMA